GGIERLAAFEARQGEHAEQTVPRNEWDAQERAGAADLDEARLLRCRRCRWRIGVDGCPERPSRRDDGLPDSSTGWLCPTDRVPGLLEPRGVGVEHRCQLKP